LRLLLGCSPSSSAACLAATELGASVGMNGRLWDSVTLSSCGTARLAAPVAATQATTTQMA
jgi:hypothetical protein